MEPAWYVHDDALNAGKLLEAFQQFFRENAEHWLERFDYRELQGDRARSSRRSRHRSGLAAGGLEQLARHPRTTGIGQC